MAIDLATPKFWLFVLAAVLLLTPVVHAAARRMIFAGVNVAFLAAILDHRGFAAVLVGLAVLYVLLAGAGKAGPRVAAVATILIGCMLLFVLHKLPWMAGRLHAGRLAPILTAVGYSYIFLRVIDVARATWESRTPPPGPVDLVNYLTPFHMLAAGPIQAWDEFVAQPWVAEPLTFDQSLTMIERIVHGLFKKYILAFAVKSIFLTNGRAGGWYSLVEMNMMYLWLFLDFSAYSDIAVGIGGLMGVATPENFKKPYFARNITDFWERWHISLSMWIRRNLFFPLQIAMMRRTQGKYALTCASVAIFISFTLCGIWHALTLPYLLWGLLNGAALAVSNLYRVWLRKRLGGPGVARYMASRPIRWLAVVITFEFVAFAIMVQMSEWIYK
jgi:D-alanyl-lipoteichoic acid acyltransferase DltB (MBOAT superfamily)